MVDTRPDLDRVATVVHRGGEAFDVTTRAGHNIRVEGSGVGADTTGPGPMQLLLVGLATCTGINVAELLTKMRQPFSALEVEVSGRRAEEAPRIWTDIALHYRVAGPVDERRLERAIWLSETKICSAAAMLSKAATITHTQEVVQSTGQPSEASD